MKQLIEAGKIIGGSLLGTFLLVAWLIFCGLPTVLLYLVHYLWISRRFIRQVVTKKPQYLGSPIYVFIELLIFLPVALFMIPT